MKRLKSFMISALMIGGTLAALAQGYKYQTVKGDPMHTRIYTLDNGLKVYLSVNKEKPRIQTYIGVRTGSRNDPAETTGLAHYLEHLMFKGTRQFGTSNMAAEAPLLDSIENRFEQYRHITDPAKRKRMYAEIDSISQLAARYNIPNEYDKLMAAIGSEGSNAYTSNDVTCYIENIPSNELDNWAKIQADRFQNMVIRGFHTELEAVYEEYNIGLANDENKEFEALMAKLFPGHPYGTQTTIGTQEHLKNPSITNIKNYFSRYYVPNNVAICMAGDLDPDKTVAIIDKYFHTWKPSRQLSFPQYAPVRNLTAPADTTVVGQQAANVMLAWKFDRAASFQTDTLEVISQMLSNGKAGLMDLDLDQKMKWLGGGSGTESLAEYSLFVLQGMPKQGQSLDEVKQLMLGEMERLKRGDFDDDLLPSVVNNMKLAYYRQLEDNAKRTDLFLNAFINGQKWEDVVHRMDRISGMTKQQIVDFARRHMGDNYAIVYKKQGTDTSEKKIEKPHITAIPTNRDKQSDFVTAIANSKTEPIKPVFVDFDKAITKAQTKKGLPVLYVKNTENGIFNLSFKFDFGSYADPRLSYAADYLDYLGTDKLTAEQIKKQFYKLACNYGVNVDGRNVYVSLSGLGENMPQALALLENVMRGAKADMQAYRDYVALVKKSREDKMDDQKSNFRALTAYAVYGPESVRKGMMTNAELDACSPQALVDLIHGLANFRHTVEYYGPEELKTLLSQVDRIHKTVKKLQAPLKGEEPVAQPTTRNEVVMAPYEAKNIFMMQYHNENQQWSEERAPIINLFNNYFGGGMNTVVFQELRESRGLAYSASANYIAPSLKGHPEYAQTMIISQNDKMMDCIRVFHSILDTIPQGEQAFELAKQSLQKSIAASRISKKSLISAYDAAIDRGYMGDLRQTVYEQLPSLTLQDIVRFEQQTMARKPWRYIILGDEKNIDMKGLEKLGPVKHVSKQDIFGY